MRSEEPDPLDNLIALTKKNFPFLSFFFGSKNLTEQENEQLSPNICILYIYT